MVWMFLPSHLADMTFFWMCEHLKLATWLPAVQEGCSFCLASLTCHAPWLPAPLAHSCRQRDDRAEKKKNLRWICGLLLSVTKTANSFDRLTQKPDICAKINPISLYLPASHLYTFCFNWYFTDAANLFNGDDPYVKDAFTKVSIWILEVCSRYFYQQFKDHLLYCHWWFLPCFDLSII